MDKKTKLMALFLLGFLVLSQIPTILAATIEPISKDLDEDRLGIIDIFFWLRDLGGSPLPWEDWDNGPSLGNFGDTYPSCDWDGWC